MTAQADGLYSFDRFVIDARSAILRCDGAAVPLRPKSFDVLLYLVRNRGRLASKDELFDRLWPGVVVTENSLVQCIKEVRQALGDDRQAMVQTVAKRGYVFTPLVAEGGGDPPATEIAPSMVAAGHASKGAKPVRETPDLPLPDRPSIAILPFDNISGDPEQDYFADGISEDLITGLARIRWLFVIARNSSFVYKGRPVDVKQVSRELGVRYVLEGSVRRAGSRLRISAQLIDAITGGHHWAERYDRELGDIFAIQDDITRNVAGAIEPRLLAAEGLRALARSPDDLGAWELVAQAQTRFWRMTQADYDFAIRSLERACAAHPDYAPAQGLLGFRLVFAAHMGWVERERGLRLGGRHADRAIALDDQDPWGYGALGYWALMERRTEDAIAACRRASNFNPNSAVAHGHLGHIFAFSGQDGEAIRHSEEAIRLSPVDPEMAFFHGGIAVAHYSAGRFTEAALHAAEALRLRPGFQGAQRMRAASLAQIGKIEEARTMLAAARRAHAALSIDWVRANVPYQTPALMEHYLKGLRLAGL